MTEPDDPGSPVVVFDTASDIEASVVMALLDSHGIGAFRVVGEPAGDLADGRQRRWAASRWRWPAPVAEEARRIIDSHREDVGQRVVRLPDESRRAGADASATGSRIAGCSSRR